MGSIMNGSARPEALARLDVFVGALAALWAVSALAVFGGAKLLARVPARWIRLAGTVTLTGLGIYRLAQAVRGLI
jgi:Ca2+/H+ antiporter, TMEM165/GDT1 family